MGESTTKFVGPLTAAASTALGECMNDPEETMHDETHNRNRGLLAHRVALEGAALAIELAAGISAPLKSLADQVIRSAASVPAIPPRAAERPRRHRKARTAVGAD